MKLRAFSLAPAHGSDGQVAGRLANVPTLRDCQSGDARRQQRVGRPEAGRPGACKRPLVGSKKPRTLCEKSVETHTPTNGLAAAPACLRLRWKSRSVACGSLVDRCSGRPPRMRASREIQLAGLWSVARVGETGDTRPVGQTVSVALLSSDFLIAHVRVCLLWVGRLETRRRYNDEDDLRNPLRTRGLQCEWSSPPDNCCAAAACRKHRPEFR